MLDSLMMAPCILPRLISMSPENIVDMAMIDMVQQVEVNCSTMITSKSGIPAFNNEDNNFSSTKRRRLDPLKYLSHNLTQQSISIFESKSNPSDFSVKSDIKDACHYDKDYHDTWNVKLSPESRLS